MITYDSDDENITINKAAQSFYVCNRCKYIINNKDLKAIDMHKINCKESFTIENEKNHDEYQEKFKEIKESKSNKGQKQEQKQEQEKINFNSKEIKEKNIVKEFKDKTEKLSSKELNVMNNTISYKLFEKKTELKKEIEIKLRKNYDDDNDNEDLDFYSLIIYEGANNSNNYYVLNKKDLIQDFNSENDIPLSYIEEANLSNKNIKLIISKKNVDLSELTSLTILNLSNNLLKEVYFLGAIKSLKILNLSKNNIESLVSLEELVNLENLNVSFNKITIISSLTKLTKLIRLNLQDNTIQYVNCTSKVLKTLRNLIELGIKNNNVRLIIKQYSF